MSRSVPAIAREQVGVFLAEQAYGAGWTPQQLRTAVRRGDVHRLWRGVYATPVPSTAEGRSARLVQRAVGAALSGHDVVVSHLACAGLRSWPWWAADPHPCVTAYEPSLTVIGDVHVHRGDIPFGDAVVSGIGPVTSAGRTVVDIAREFGVEAGLVTADGAIRLGGLSFADLTSAVGRAGGRPGVRQAREVLDLVEPLSESPLETRSRYRIHRAGLPAPRCQAVVLDMSGTFVARVDFLWEEFGVVGEANGRGKYERDRGLRGLERQRVEALTRLGLVVEPWGWADLEPFDATARRLRNTLALASARPRARRWRVAEPKAA